MGHIRPTVWYIHFYFFIESKMGKNETLQIVRVKRECHPMAYAFLLLHIVAALVEKKGECMSERCNFKGAFSLSYQWNTYV